MINFLLTYRIQLFISILISVFSFNTYAIDQYIPSTQYNLIDASSLTTTSTITAPKFANLLEQIGNIYQSSQVGQCYQQINAKVTKQNLEFMLTYMTINARQLIDLYHEEYPINQFWANNTYHDWLLAFQLINTLNSETMSASTYNQEYCNSIVANGLHGSVFTDLAYAITHTN